MIHWPAIIKYHGDSELDCVRSETEWQHNTGLNSARYQPEDRLIDANGSLFRLEHNHDGTLVAAATAHTLTLAAFIELVQQHAASTGECCIEKIRFRSIAEGMAVVASLCDKENR